MAIWSVLGICGSLRRNSYNAGLLRLAGRSHSSVSVVGEGLVGRLPLFNPDLDNDDDLPDAVAEFRSCADRAEGVIIVSPEYAHGPSGVTKNAMDWLIGSGGLAGKPTLLMSASPGQAGGMRGHLALIPTLTLMGSVLVDSVTVSGAPSRADARGDFTDPAVIERVRLSMEEMATALSYSGQKKATSLLLE
ncbi:NAD(P)H-dependent oxidoreductase [Nocardiopsis tropica]|uniref:NAD(P)H-dependent oxidoreductase n=1 Tax=Nocardiopsis tropica TaxID=109330 RepID=A0ABU7KP89_9ACTN|nr:NAD(P)H-dependent oxidoreductase [Nocardiopsis umidischolae]MEE2050834.1 NAD(P)H-dependent oxidoreductase [Nocardiopsis umidischolae]